MGLLKELTRVPWNLLKPVRERVVFRLLHYGRVVVRPLEDDMRKVRFRIESIGGQVTRTELGMQAVLRDLARLGPGGDTGAWYDERSPEARRLLSRGSGPRVISYARNREDVRLARLFSESHEGFYVDAGAGDPTVSSVTRLFHDRGWRGINVQPSRPVFDRLVEERPRDVNLNVGLGAASSELTLHESPDGTVPLAKLLDAYGAPEIDVLRLGTRDARLEVLKGNNWDRFRPRVLVIEAPPAAARDGSAGGWGEEGKALLRDARYTFATFDGLSHFYVRDEDAAWAEVLQVPPNVEDHFVPYELMAGLDERYRELRDLHQELVALRGRLEKAEVSIGRMLDGGAPALPGSDGDPGPTDA